LSAIENLKLVVDVDIASAIGNLEELQKELSKLAEKIKSVDTRGSKGINISARLDDLDTELARLETELEAFEAANDLDIDVDFKGLSTEVAKVRSEIAALEATGGTSISADVKKATRLIPEGRFGEMSMEDISAGIDLRGGLLGDTKVGRKISNLSKGLSNASDEIGEFDLRMTDMHNMLARLVPLLLVFIGAVPAVVTALVGLAAAAVAAGSALLAIAGFGAMGVAMEGGEFNMQNLTDVLEEIQRDFLDAFAPLAERLEPLFRDAADAMTLFFNAVAQQGDALMELTDEARAFGQFMMDWVPDVLVAMAAMAEAFAPVFGAMGDALQDAQVLRTITKLAMEAIPAIAQMAENIIAAVPFLVRMSIGFAMVSNTIIELLSTLGSFLRMIGISPEVLGLLIGSLLGLASAVALTNTIMGSFIAKTMLSAIWSMRMFALTLVRTGSIMTAFKALVNGTLIKSMYSTVVASLAGSGGMITFGSAVQFARSAVLSLLATVPPLLILFGLLSVIVPKITDQFTSLDSSIQGATSAIKEFDRVSGKADTAFNPYSGGGSSPDDGGGGISGPSGNVIIESSGDAEKDRSNGRYASWRNGRTTGGNN
jgi:hypothetical protein